MRKADDYFNTIIKPILSPLFMSILSSQPEDVVEYSIDFLKKKYNLNDDTLSIKEKTELFSLREAVLNSPSDSSDSFEDEIEVDAVPLPKNQLRRRKGIVNIPNKIDIRLHPKNDNEKIFIKTALISLTRFFPLNFINELINAFEPVSFLDGEVIIKANEGDDNMYIITDGEINCYKQFESFNQMLVKVYLKGEIFNEASILHPTVSACTFIASKRASCFRLSRGAYTKIIQKNTLEKNHELRELISRSSLFGGADRFFIDTVVDIAKEREIKKGTEISFDGFDVIYLVIKGRIGFMIEDKLIKEYKEGDYFIYKVSFAVNDICGKYISLSDTQVILLNYNSITRLIDEKNLNLY